MWPRLVRIAGMGSIHIPAGKTVTMAAGAIPPQQFTAKVFLTVQIPAAQSVIPICVVK